MFTEVHGGKNYGEFSGLSIEISPLHFPQEVPQTLRIMQNTEADGIRTRIAIEIDNLGLTVRELSIKAGMNPDTLGKFMSGKTQSLKANNLSSVARVLQVSESYLTGSDLDGPKATPNVMGGVRYGGIVEAGAFRTQNDMNQGDDYRIIPVAPDPRFPRHAQFAFEVVGDSMTQEKIFEGMWVLAVDLVEYERLHGPLEDKKLVIAERRHNGMTERELTVKRLRMFQDRIELQPASENPVHKPIVFPLPLRESEEVEATIRAVLLSAIWLYR